MFQGAGAGLTFHIWRYTTHCGSGEKGDGGGAFSVFVGQEVERKAIVRGCFLGKEVAAEK
jgi:hypothetical protein